MKCPHCGKPVAIAVDKPFYTTAEAAAIAKVSTQTVINWIEAGRFPGPRIERGRRHVLKRPFLEYMVQFGCPGAEAELALLNLAEA
jgi:excisionase family DNA binding protein